MAAHYSARNRGSITEVGNNVSAWRDLSGNGRDLTTTAGTPVYGASLVNGRPGINFAGAKMVTSAFPLTANVTLFAVFQYRAPGTWGPVAHHGNRDNDWSMEHNGFRPNTVMHWQSVNDNSGLELTFAIGTDYINVGRFTGTTRYFSQTSTVGGTNAVTGSGSSISPGNKVLFVGGSDVNEFSNHYLGELIYYSQALDDTQVSAVVAYLRGAWGI
jgi:hypothetical protein